MLKTDAFSAGAWQTLLGACLLSVLLLLHGRLSLRLEKGLKYLNTD